MMIIKINPSVEYHQWLKLNLMNQPFKIHNTQQLKRFDTQRNEPTKKVPKVYMPTYKKSFFKTLVTSIINSPMSPLSLGFITKDKLTLTKYLQIMKKNKFQLVFASLHMGLIVLVIWTKLLCTVYNEENQNNFSNN